MQPPNEFHPGEWVVVYQFADGESLRRWLSSPTRTALLADGNELVEGRAREQVLALDADAEPVSAVSSARVRPEQSAAYRALHERLVHEVSTFPGFIRNELFEPVEGVQDDTIAVVVFDDRVNLERWLGSDARRRLIEQMDAIIDGSRTVNVVGGFAGWFSPRPGGGREVKRWKQTIAVLIALVPTSLAFTGLRMWLFPDLHPVPTVVLGNVVGIVVLTWLLMPVVTHRLQGWLRR